MRPSRGMGAVRASKMPGGKKITRKDNPGKVTAFGKGGMVKKADGGKVSAFGQAFKDARSAGQDTFTFNGKKYTTEMADTKKDTPTPINYHKPSEGTKKIMERAARTGEYAEQSTNAPERNRTYNDDYKEMMGRDKAPAKRMTFREALAETASRDAARNAASDARTAAAAKRRGDAVKGAVQNVGSFLSGTGTKRRTLKEAFEEVGKRDAERYARQDAERERRSRALGRAVTGKAKGGKVKESDEDDKTQDKAMVKKAFKQHESAAHGGKHTELKLKKGGKANFIKGAIKKPGALRASLGAKKGEPIPAGKLAAAANKPGKLGQRARFAEMLKGFKKNKK